MAIAYANTDSMTALLIKDHHHHHHHHHHSSFSILFSYLLFFLLFSSPPAAYAFTGILIVFLSGFILMCYFLYSLGIEKWMFLCENTWNWIEMNMNHSFVLLRITYLTKFQSPLMNSGKSFVLISAHTCLFGGVDRSVSSLSSYLSLVHKYCMMLIKVRFSFLFLFTPGMVRLVGYFRCCVTIINFMMIFKLS